MLQKLSTPKSLGGCLWVQLPDDLKDPHESTAMAFGAGFTAPQRNLIQIVLSRLCGRYQCHLLKTIF